MDKFIIDFIREYQVLIHNVIEIGAIIVAWVLLSGAIRFGIAIWRRKKGIYPAAPSQMENH